MDKSPKTWVRDRVRALNAYHVPDSSGYIKLDAMENPYPWPSEMTVQWQDLLADVALNRYPDPAAADLTQKLREYYQIPAEQDILLGNGSDEIIQILAQLMLAEEGEQRTILAPEPGFVMYKHIALACGLNYAGVPLTEQFELDGAAMLAAVKTHQPALTFLAYPNNPTGNCWDRGVMQQIIEASPGLVIIDEAYAPFANDHCLDYLARYDNVLVMRTLSKFGLAGLRLGMIFGNPEWINEINKLRLPYNINVLSQVSASFALEHAEVFEAQAAEIRLNRSVLSEALAALPHVEVYPSDANFILFRIPNARALHATLREQKILIKCVDGAHPQLQDCLRVTVGTEAENTAFLSALKAAL